MGLHDWPRGVAGWLHEVTAPCLAKVSRLHLLWLHLLWLHLLWLHLLWLHLLWLHLFWLYLLWLWVSRLCNCKQA